MDAGINKKFCNTCALGKPARISESKTSVLFRCYTKNFLIKNLEKVVKNKICTKFALALQQKLAHGVMVTLRFLVPSF